MSTPTNIKPGVREEIGGDQIALQLCDALVGLFTITGHRKFERYRGEYVTLFCKPSKSVAASLSIDREVLALIANYADLHARTVSIVKSVIDSTAPQLTPRLAIVLHSDEDGDRKLRAWGKESGITVFPVFRPLSGAVPPRDIFRQRLSRELFSADPFQITGPVADDADFFGRGNDALNVLRQLDSGRIKSTFGIRKVGKTSLINRVVSLAKQSKSPDIAMIDCSIGAFSSQPARTALRMVAEIGRRAQHRGYSHIAELRGVDGFPELTELWKKKSGNTLAIIFDEVDYITPGYPAPAHWEQDFVEFWRELRAFVQESQRNGLPLSILVSGVSSRPFRVAMIGGSENPALHFIPDDYLPPFVVGAAKPMIADLGKRCGLSFTNESREYIWSVCAGFPYWIRMAGSYIHRAIDVESRPIELGISEIRPLIERFVEEEGADISEVAISHLRDVYPEVVEVLQRLGGGDAVSSAECGPLCRYGLGTNSRGLVSINKGLVSAGTARVKAPLQTVATPQHDRLEVSDDVWAEELAVLNRRRNTLEASIRNLIRFTLKSDGSKETWVSRVLKCLPDQRRQALSSYSSGALMAQLYWKELGSIIVKNWISFERVLGDRNRFENAMEILNDRPDAHAKNIDLAELALHRRELSWLESRVES